jgi:hypothetical protein
LADESPGFAAWAFDSRAASKMQSPSLLPFRPGLCVPGCCQTRQAALRALVFCSNSSTRFGSRSMMIRVQKMSLRRAMPIAV